LKELPFDIPQRRVEKYHRSHKPEAEQAQRQTTPADLADRLRRGLELILTSSTQKAIRSVRVRVKREIEVNLEQLQSLNIAFQAAVRAGRQAAGGFERLPLPLDWINDEWRNYKVLGDGQLTLDEETRVRELNDLHLTLKTPLMQLAEQQNALRQAVSRARQQHPGVGPNSSLAVMSDKGDFWTFIEYSFKRWLVTFSGGRLRGRRHCARTLTSSRFRHAHPPQTDPPDHQRGRYVLCPV
jgi:hypothetical protein